jgi:nucleotide-binding universal stress UspA family protein
MRALRHALDRTGHVHAHRKVATVADARARSLAGRDLLPTVGDFLRMREKFRVDTVRQLEELTAQQPQLTFKPEFVVEFGSPSEKILQTSNTFKADAIMLGLHCSD